MKGNLQEMSIADLVQHNCQYEKTASVLIEHEERRVEIFFESGQVVHAAMDDLTGEEAVYHAMAWADGVFELRADVETPNKTINRNWPGLLLEGYRLIDEGLLSEEASLEGKANLPSPEEKEDLLLELAKFHQHSKPVAPAEHKQH